MKKLLRSLLKTVLVIFILLNVILAFHAWKFTHFYNDPDLRKPSANGLMPTLKFILVGNKIPKSLEDSIPAAPHTDVTINTTDNLKLAAWSIPVISNNADTVTSGAKGTVIMYHGHGDCRATLLPAANAILKMGYNVFLLDFRAHGNSDGEQCMVGIKESADVKAAYDYVRKTGEKNIVLLGVSMGAAAVTKALHDYTDLKPEKVILEMPFATMLDATQGKLKVMGLPPQLGALLTFWGGTLNGEWAFSHKPYEFAEKITCPVLLQWGANDPRVSKNETDEIFSHLGTTDKKLVVYETAGHENLYKKETAKWEANVGAFLQ
jgi:alpha-beta hydrolase superfamily lysophospholipase